MRFGLSWTFVFALLAGACGGGGDPSAPFDDAGLTDSGTPDANPDVVVSGVCGDRNRDNDEACDDGNTNGDDYCSPDCQRVTGRCGDGIEQGNEVCDGDARCNGSCDDLIAFCGDGFVDASEECDTGFNLFSGTVGCAECRVVGLTRCEREPSLCGPTSLDWDQPLNTYAAGDLDRYCRWLHSASYGDLSSVSCGGGTTLTPLDHATCVARSGQYVDDCVAPLRQVIECWRGVSVCELNVSGPTLTAVAECERLVCTRSCEPDIWACADNKGRLCNPWGNGYGDEIDCGNDVCNDGATATDNACDPDQCALATDDCDDNATCANTTPGFTCTCNAGYEGDGATCLRVPALDTLRTDLEGLRPAFSPTVLEYALDVPLLGADSITITASTADAVGITLLGNPFASGSTSGPIALNQGTTVIDVALYAEGYTTVTYTIRVNKNVPTRIKPVATDYDEAGAAVAISGNTLIVGTPYAISGPELFNRTTAVTVYEWLNGVWTETAPLLSASTEARRTGSSVAIDGDVAVIGEPAGVAGRVYWSERSDGTWDTHYLTGGPTDSDDAFGTSVAISGDTIVVGVPGDDSSATGVGGSQTNNAMPNAGAAYVFVKSGDTWTRQAFLKASNTDASDAFGTAVSIDGDTVVVGAPAEDSALSGVDTDGNDDDATDSGAVYVFHRTGTSWVQQAYLKPTGTTGARVGTAVDVDGDSLVVGAPSAATTGAAFVYVREASTWTLTTTLTPSLMTQATEFGTSVALRGAQLVVGAPRAGQQVLANIGGAYVFTRGVVGWSETAYFGAGRGRSGASVDLDTWVVIGVPGDDAYFTPVPPNPAMGGTDSGAVYVF